MSSIQHPIYLLNSDRPFHVFSVGKNKRPIGWQFEQRQITNSYTLLIGCLGQIPLQAANEPIILKRGTFLLVPHGQAFCGTRPVKGDVSYYWITFFPKDSQKVINEGQLHESMKDRRQHSQIINNVILPLTYQINNFAPIEADLIEDLADIQAPTYTDAISSYLLTSLMLKISNDFLNGFDGTRTISDKTLQIQQWIKNNMSKTLTVKETADHFAMNYRYLSQLLKHETGETTTTFITNQKISIAKDLLLESNLPIKVIADQAYFNDSKYFLRIFKEKVGMTPTEYRRHYMRGFLVHDTLTRSRYQHKH